MPSNIETGRPSSPGDRHVPRSRRFQLFAALVVALAVAAVAVAAVLAAENDEPPPAPAPASSRGPA